MKHRLFLLMNYFTVFTPIFCVLLLLLRFTSSSIFGCRNWNKLNLRVAFKLSSDREFRDLGFAIFMRENICSYTLLYNSLNGHKLLVTSQHRSNVALLSHTSQVPQMTCAGIYERFHVYEKYCLLIGFRMNDSRIPFNTDIFVGCENLYRMTVQL